MADESDKNNTAKNDTPLDTEYLTISIYGSMEGFLKDNITNTWGDAGYTTNNVEKWSWATELKNFKLSNILGTLSFGLFGGGSIFGSTRYFYNYIQQVSPLQGGHIPDAIDTYAMTGVLKGNDPSQSVQEALKTGKGYKLKKYYQYYKHRYKNRQWTWEAYKTTNLKPSSITVNTHGFVQTLPDTRRYKVIDETKQFTSDGQLYMNWLQEEFGIDTFHEGTPLNQDNRPTEKTVGITLWSSDVNPRESLQKVIGKFTTTKLYDKVADLSKVGDYKQIVILKVSDNPYDTGNLVKDNKDEISEEIKVNPEEAVVITKVTLVSMIKGHDETYYTYLFEEIYNAYTYDQEHHYYLTEDNKSNYPDFSRFWFIKEEESTLDERINSKDNPNVFKFYAPIPIKDWFEGKDTWQQVIPKLSQDSGIVKAIKETQKLTTEALEENTEELSADSVKGSRVTNKLKRKRNKEEGSIKLNSITKAIKEVDKSEKDLNRFVLQELGKSRRVEFNEDKLADIVKYEPRKLKRRIETLTSYLDIDYIQHTASLMSQSYWNGGYTHVNTYQSSLYLGAIFSNQTTENHHYWYEWAKRQYKLAGKESSLKEWIALVQSANSLSDLPQQVVKYKTTDGTHWGGFSYAFITKFEITGRTREIKRKSRLHDILRGKPVTIDSLERLRTQIEPLREIASDGWYYNDKSGKEYPIGGENFSGGGYTEGDNPDIRQVLQNYSYTLFCKNSGNNKITCYAICGLQFHTKMSERRLWCSAWYDLGMEFERLRQKYIDNKKSDDIQVLVEVERGSRKHRHINRIYNFGIIPLEYDIITRMPATILENFAQRAVLNYSFLFQEQKGGRGAMKYLSPVIQIVGFIVAIVLAIPSGGSSITISAWSSAMVAQFVTNAAINTVISLVAGYALKKYVLPALGRLGIKGIAQIIVLVVLLVAAAYFGGNLSNSALPIASETTAKASTVVGQEVVQSTVKESVTTVLKNTMDNLGKVLIDNVAGSSLPQIINKGVTYGAEYITQQQQQEIADIQSAQSVEAEQANRAMRELEDMQAEMQSSMAQYDVKQVLSSLVQPRFKSYEQLTESALDDIGILPSYEFFTAFLDLKLNLDPETFDPIESTNFSFNQPNNPLWRA